MRAAASAATPTPSTGTPAGRAPGRRPRSRPASCRRRSARRPTGRSSVRRRPTASSASSRPSASSAGPASSPSRTAQDTAGPMARTVRDAAIVLGVLAGPDPRDPATAESETRGLGDYTPYLDTEGLAGARIGVARGFAGFHEQVDGLLAAALDAMRARGGRDRGSGRALAHACRPGPGRGRGAAPRVQGRPERLPRRARPGRAGPLAGRDHRVQPPARGRGDALLPAGAAGGGGGAGDRSRSPPTSPRAGRPAGCRARRASTA